jgi:hypothetical protein
MLNSSSTAVALLLAVITGLPAGAAAPASSAANPVQALIERFIAGSRKTRFPRPEP